MDMYIAKRDVTLTHDTEAHLRAPHYRMDQPIGIRVVKLNQGRATGYRDTRNGWIRSGQSRISLVAKVVGKASFRMLALDNLR